MAKVEDCPGFETFGADVKAAREAKRLARKTLAVCGLVEVYNSYFVPCIVREREL